MVKPEIYRSLGLTDNEYQRILDILNRDPTATELAMFSVEWSEHCGYPRSRNWLKLLPRTGKYETFLGEDAGGIIVDNLAIVFKIESHNHPSQVEPKQGAGTGVGGIIRDIFTTGARPIALLDSLRFGPLKKSFNRYIARGVVDGIQFYGNCVGVPTVGGEAYFDECYSGNCLVNVMCIGIANKEELLGARFSGVGSSIIYVGARTGRDGIGGCSVLASQELGEDEEKRPNVQIGDPFTEKCLIEATLEAAATRNMAGIKDMGAAGLTCATSEMASAGGSGAEIELRLVPRREAGMEPWEVMMSESQERMLLCVREGKEEEIERIFKKWDLGAQAIGKVTGDGIVRIRDNGKIVAEIEAQALTKAPVYDMHHKKPEYLEKVNKLDIKKLPEPKDYNRVLLRLLASPSISSKKTIYEQYDHMVQTNTITLPGSDSAVLRIKGTSIAIAATTDCNSRYCYLNPYRGAQIAVAEAARNLVCSGAEPVALTDCLNLGNPEKPDRFFQFKSCVEGIADACKFLNLAVISGNVSFYNESPRGAIYPTPVIGMVGIIDDFKKVCTQYFKGEGHTVILLGLCKEELGGSEYLKEIHRIVGGNSPEMHLQLEQGVQLTALEVIRKGLAYSAHDCSEGGLAVALAECCISDRENMLGANIDKLNSGIRPDALLFGESQSRIILSCKEDSVTEIRNIARKNNAPFQVVGHTGGKRLRIWAGEKELINLPLGKQFERWANSLESLISN